MIYIILGNGFEEAEAVVPCDILRRGGVDVRLAGVGGLDINGGHGIIVKADCRIEDADARKAEMIIVPGGMGGVRSILGSPAAMAAVKTAYQAGREVAAICAGPTVLSELGILEGRRAVCYPGMEGELSGAFPAQESAVVRDGKVTTGRGPGAAFDFGFALLETLKGPAATERVRAETHYGER